MDTQPKLNMLKTFIWCPGRHMNVLRIFNLLHYHTDFHIFTMVLSFVMGHFKMIFLEKIVSIFDKKFEWWLNESSLLYVNKYCRLPLFFSKMLVANTVAVVYGVQNWCRCQCKAHFIKKVKLQKQQLRYVW